MTWLVILGVGLLESLLVAAFAFAKAKGVNDSKVVLCELLKDEVAQKQALWSKVEATRAEMASEAEFVSKAREFLAARESLKAERGRVTITQAELETLENRLRELDEISRELEASTTETKEELKILQRKESELKTRNDALRDQIANSTAKMDALMAEIEMTAKMQEQVSVMKAELFRAEEQSQSLLNEIQRSNEQYFILKRRYDALDVEYAQLYQQFSEQNHRG